MSRPAVSYYSATVERNPGRFPALKGAAETEVCVVGGGAVFTIGLPEVPVVSDLTTW